MIFITEVTLTVIILCISVILKESNGVVSLNSVITNKISNSGSSFIISILVISTACKSIELY